MTVNENPSRRGAPSAEISDEALLWLVRLHSGEATAALRRSFEAWRALSDEHEAAAREAEALWAESSELHLDPESGIVKPGRRDDPTRRAVVVGAIGLAAGGGLWAGGFFEKPADHATGLGETRVVALADGSRVTLNARSAIDVAFTPQARRVRLLRGEAYFEVAPDRSRPFEVEARDATVTALGTAFDVDSNLASEGVAVAVAQRSVLVASRAVSSRGPVDLGEGQMLVVDRRGEIGAVRAVDTSAVTAWRSGLYVAEDKPLGDVVAALRAYHAGWIVVGGREIAALRVDAVLDLREPDAALDALAAGLPVAIRRFSPYLTVISG
jgi:transmembrane sensor